MDAATIDRIAKLERKMTALINYFNALERAKERYFFRLIDLEKRVVAVESSAQTNTAKLENPFLGPGDGQGWTNGE